jgi:hypothetical protein
MNTFSNPLDLFSELHSLKLNPRIENGRLKTTGPIPEDLLCQIRGCKDELFRIIKEIDDPEPGMCIKCCAIVPDRFLGGYCLGCVDRLLGLGVKSNERNL